MAALGYVYNRAAANLRSANIGLIGLVINDLRNPFFTEFATTAQMAFSARGYATVLANADEDPALQKQVIGSMIEHGVSGILISPSYGDGGASFELLARAQVPTMQVLRHADQRFQLFPLSAPDNSHGAVLATRHLFDVGANNVAFAGGLEGRSITDERLSGYLEAIRAAGREPVTYLGRSSRAFGRELAIRLSEERPEIDGAVCFNDLVALGMLSGFNQIGRKVGEEFRLIGFDDIEECSEAWPQLSSISCGVKKFGSEAAATMLAWLENGEKPEPEHRASVELVARMSSLGHLAI
nr:substrate-binding domain-containing protein [Roseibium sp. RKSG952]